MLLKCASGMRQWTCIVASCMFFSLQSVTVFAEEPKASQTDEAYARSIVEKADHVRFPADGFQVDVVMNSESADKPAEPR